MPYKVPLVFSCGNWLLSTACCLSCLHIPNWAELTCVCACPFLAAIDEDANEGYQDVQTVLYRRVLNWELLTFAAGGEGFTPKWPFGRPFAAVCTACGCGDPA